MTIGVPGSSELSYTVNARELPVSRHVALAVADATDGLLGSDVAVSVQATDAGGSVVAVSPLELMVDQPVAAGCFEAAGVTTTTLMADLTPHKCLVECLGRGSRYALVGGLDCGCAEAITHDMVKK